jgi:drug/metabolite transporter (DMT)-like permease
VTLAASAGILTYGVAAVGYVAAIQMIGAGKTVLLTTTAPLFVLPFSIFILKEKPTYYTIAGIVLCVGGIGLVVS